MSDHSVPLQALLVSSGERASSAGYELAKRLIDALASLVLLVASLPLLLLVAVLIKLDSRGPVFFTQRRVGGKRRRGRDGAVQWAPVEFSLIKFRSMVANADPRPHEEHVRRYVSGELSRDDGTGFKLAGDARITRVGRFLRRTSLDELPQLFNVLRGDMSLVGPRPVPTYEVAQYADAYLDRFAAPSGITGLWQVEGRGDVTFAEMMRLDMTYVHNRGFRLDMKILFRTIPTLVRRTGAS